MNTVLSIFIGLLSILGWQTSLESYRQQQQVLGPLAVNG